MTGSDVPRMAMLVQAMAAMLKGEVTEAMLEGYYVACREMTIEEFETAAHRAIRELEFMPSAEDMRTLSGRPKFKLHYYLPLPAEDKAEIARIRRSWGGG